MRVWLTECCCVVVLLCCVVSKNPKTLKTTVVEYRYSNSAEHGIVFVLLAVAIGTKRIYENNNKNIL